MYTSTLDQYQPKESLIHRFDPRVKVAMTVLLVLSNVLLPDGAWLAFFCSWMVVVGVNRLADISFRALIARSFIALPFALAAVSVIFSVPGNPLATIGMGSAGWVISDAGVIRFLSILLRSWISVQAAIVMTVTTAFPDLIHALRHLRVPAILVAIISFMYRYLFVLSDEALRLLRARESRSARPERGGGGTLVWHARVAGNMAGQLFLRSYERSDRVYHAMLARGYRGQFLTMNPHVMDQRDWVAGMIGLLVLVVLQWIGRIQ